MSEKTGQWYAIAHPVSADRVILRRGDALGFLVYPRDADALTELLNALTSERDEAVRVAGELRAKAALADAVLDEWDDCSYLPQCDTLANAVMTYAKATGQIYDRCEFCARHAILTSGLCRECNPNRLQLDALTQGGDLPLKENEG